MRHHEITAPSAAHSVGFRQTTDPSLVPANDVQPNAVWIEVDGGDVVQAFWIRDAANAAWTQLSATPNGPAGGVLSANYPNPGFAVDMATQAELDAETAARIAADALLIPLTQKAAASGVASLDAGTKVPVGQIPDLDAAKITTGVLGIARLATGTPSGAKFVRDDSTLAVPPGVTTLDGLTDVNAPTPANNDVLTWDSTPGEWVAAAPASVPSTLDSLTDVVAPTPADGEVLTWDSGTSKWVNEAPAGGGGSALYTRWDELIPDVTPHADTDEFTSNTVANYTTIYNADSGVVVDFNSTIPGSLYMEATSNTYHIKGLVKALPAGDFTIHTRVRLHPAQLADAQAVGIVLSTNNTAGAGSQTIYGIGTENAGWKGYMWSWNQWGNTATGNTNTKPAMAYTGFAQIRVRRVSTTYYYAIKVDGGPWYETTFAPCFGSAPAYWGVGLLNYSGALAKADFQYLRFYATGTQYETGAVRSVSDGGAVSNRLQPTTRQRIALRGDGTLTLPSTPIPGNLLLFIYSGFTGSESSYRPTGFEKMSSYDSDGNNRVGAWRRICQSGDTGSYSITASDNQGCELYEITNADYAYPVAGGALSGMFSGSAFSLPMPGTPYEGPSIRIVAFEHDGSQAWTITAGTGLTTDYNPASDGNNHQGTVISLADTFIGNVTGSTSAAPSQPVYGIWAVIGLKP